jgi:hypothetical protein
MKIALLGASPSRSLAPFNEPSWEIWACSDGTVDVPRCELRFELHTFHHLRTEPRALKRNVEAYLEFLKVCPVYLQEAHPDYPYSLTYPKEEMVRKHGPYFFTSSIAWMMALAIEREPDEIGLWGVDMATDEEYAHQRPGCHYFIEMARRHGIGVVVPDGCRLLDPPRWEGFDH